MEFENVYPMENETAILQRYAVATMKTSLQAAIIGDPLQHECQWQGVSCVNNTVTELVWSNRSLTGSIPKEVGLLKGLKHLDLGENQIGGVIPQMLYECTNLEYLYLHDNRISGPISENFVKLEKLISFYAGDNLLNGTLPQGLGSKGTGAVNARPLRKYNTMQCTQNVIRSGLFQPF